MIVQSIDVNEVTIVPARKGRRTTDSTMPTTMKLNIDLSIGRTTMPMPARTSSTIVDLDDWNSAKWLIASFAAPIVAMLIQISVG